MLTQLGAAELAAKLRSREISVNDVVSAHRDRIAAADTNYGAFLATTSPEQLDTAVANAQKKIDEGNSGPLTGIPVAVKDNICVQGMPTTCASKILEGFVPPYDATVTQHLQDAGAIIIGKTNLDEFAMGTSTENSAYQLSRNPWDTSRTPGGSSGGSAAAVAGELAPLSLGSDTGGSIRQPAALCGVVGFKPTYGRVSRYGLVAFGSSLDQIGPFARCVEDAALLSEAISGPCKLDSTHVPDSTISSKDLKSGSLKGKKIALPKELFSDAIHPGVRAIIDQSIDRLTKEGVEFSEISVPALKLGVTTYYIIAPAEASSNLARFDGIRYGPQVEGQGHIGGVAATRGQLFGHEVKSRIMIGTYALSAGYFDAYYLRAQKVRALMAAEFEKVFQEYDAVLSATSPCVAFKLGEFKEDPLALKLMDLCTIPANMGGFPALSLNCGYDQGLPVGLQLMGPVMGDEKLLQLSYNVEQVFADLQKRPPLD